MNHHDKVEMIGCLIGFTLMGFSAISILMSIVIVFLSLTEGM